eukprot:COSAG02_NODE_3802_length_6208_cov_214.622360_3_plen_99_part_00
MRCLLRRVVATMPPIMAAMGGMSECVCITPIRRCSASAPLTPLCLCVSSAIADKEAAEARQIQAALKKAFDEIDDDGGCAATPARCCVSTLLLTQRSD